MHTMITGSYEPLKVMVLKGKMPCYVSTGIHQTPERIKQYYYKWGNEPLCGIKLCDN